MFIPDAAKQRMLVFARLRVQMGSDIQALSDNQDGPVNRTQIEAKGRGWARPWLVRYRILTYQMLNFLKIYFMSGEGKRCNNACTFYTFFFHSVLINFVLYLFKKFKCCWIYLLLNINK